MKRNRPQASAGMFVWGARLQSLVLKTHISCGPQPPLIYFVEELDLCNILLVYHQGEVILLMYKGPRVFSTSIMSFKKDLTMYSILEAPSIFLYTLCLFTMASISLDLYFVVSLLSLKYSGRHHAKRSLMSRCHTKRRLGIPIDGHTKRRIGKHGHPFLVWHCVRLLRTFLHDTALILFTKYIRVSIKDLPNWDQQPPMYSSQKERQVYDLTYRSLSYNP